jgi:hypothetical protein
MPRTAGHKLKLTHNGEKTRAKKIWYARCICGTELQDPKRLGAVDKYKLHLAEARESQEKKAETSLSEREIRLLEYPPNEKTWVCRGKTDFGTCDTVNPGKAKKCALCFKNKPTEPELLWPVYLVACEKVGISPGEGKFRPVDSEHGLLYPKGGDRWKLIPLSQ